MFIMDDETGDMITRQGDSYSFQVEGVDDDWDLYYSVYKTSNREILFEIKTNPINQVATFEITPKDSTLMTVPEGKKTEVYYWGLKRSKDGFEDTLIVGDKQVADVNKITVYPLTTEGPDNG